MPSESLAVGLVEVLGLPPSVVVADAMVKSAAVRLVDMEVNTLGAMVIKVTGETGAVRSAFDVGERLAGELGARVATSLIPRYAAQGVVPWIEAPQKITRLLRSRSSLIPNADAPPGALGFIETVGFTGAVAALDAMCKAAEVRLASIERIGASRTAMLVRGEVSAVEVAVEAGRLEGDRVGHVAAFEVIARPDPVIASLFPG